MENKYSEADIKAVEYREIVRLRPAMFIGRVNEMGVIQLVKWLVEDIVEDASSNIYLSFSILSSHRIDLKIQGVDLDKIKAGLTVTDFYVGGRNYYSATANALCSYYRISYKGKQQQFEIGVLKNNTECDYSADVDVEMFFDETIFSDLNIDYYLMSQALYYIAVLNPTIEVKIIDSRGTSNDTLTFNFPDGIKSHFRRLSTIAFSEVKHEITIDTTIGDNKYMICVGWGDYRYEDGKHETYCNNEYLKWGGSLIDGIRQGLGSIGKQHSKGGAKTNPKFNAITIVGVLKTLDPTWIGATKSGLDMPKVKKEVKKLVMEEAQKYIAENPESGGKLLSSMYLY